MKINRVGNYKPGFKYYKNKVEITNCDEIEKIITNFIADTLENSVEICEATDRGFKLKRLKTFHCLFGDRK